MNDSRWLLYGATGFTGQLTAREAVDRGHRPVLGGRSAGKLDALANELGLDFIACDLEHPRRLAAVVAEFDLVCHLAGPYKFTYKPMLKVCLQTETNYLDITGELPVLQAMRSFDRRARERDVAIIPAAGFVAVPTDCSARYAASLISDPTQLETAVATEAVPSPGTLITMLERLPEGMVVRKDGRLAPVRLGQGSRRIVFNDHERPVLPTPQADLVTAHRSTGIPDIVTYLAVPSGSTPLLKFLAPWAQKLTSVPRIQQLLQNFVQRYVRGPDAEARRTTRAHTWVRIINAAGDEVEVWMETKEAYQFTAHTVVRAAERVLADELKGLLTPAQAFGPDFPLEIPGTDRTQRVKIEK